ncbi:hypothetical protein M0G74_17040 [Microbulbifer sp. CAU 1566]|uniref:hypothetical protein n=1 Tax=Microbulbifer sp. CAU 1566 TaxID=2933269 RepID=UPI002003D624|nr:hypothetical protein [Microbulbifer sp. CAU 1566]MCK7598982.1 hypothetical protein [Microbulbifer sp. CAU 1566]
MKKAIFVLLALISFSSAANELEVSTANITCVGHSQNGLYEYRVGLVLKNNSDKELTLISTSQGASKHYDDPTVPTVLIGNVSELKIDGVLIVPDSAELGLVTIQPTEGAQVYEIYKSRSPLGQKAKLGYHATSAYGGRFNNWQGVVTSGVEDITNYVACQP